MGTTLPIKDWEADWTAEIQAVKELGEKIGYGNMMDIASSLWGIMLEDKFGHSTGAFEPVCIAPIDEKYAKELKKSRKKRNEQIRKLLVPENMEDRLSQPKQHFIRHIVKDMDNSLIQKCELCGEIISDYRFSEQPIGDEPPRGFPSGSVFLTKGNPVFYTVILSPEDTFEDCIKTNHQH
jgi:hypothetical protein